MFTVKVKYRDNIYTYPKDITLLEISKNFKDNYKYDIIVGSINNKMMDLNAKIEGDCDVDFFDLTDHSGNRVYERGIVYLFIHAVKDVLNCDVHFEHSIDRGIYVEILSDKELDDTITDNINNRMMELVKANIPFGKLSVSRIQAIDYYKSTKQLDKVASLSYISNSCISLYRFDDLYDYFYGEMPVSTEPLKYFKLTLVKPKGIVLRYPNFFLKGEIAEYVNHEKLFTEFQNYHRWSQNLEINNVSDLNKLNCEGLSDNLIYLSELEQNSRLYKIAEYINSHPDIKVVLIAGPSSSGKTTTSKKLGLYLRSMGEHPLPLSIDNYFLDRDQTPKKEDGSYDFESLKAINVDLFNKQVKELLAGEEVTLSEFNFITGKSELNNKKLKLMEKDILVIEGLHALNEELTASIEQKNKYKIYLSPLTSINIDNHNRISTTDNRLLRRIVRDNKYRGYNAATTLKVWEDVREGEEKYVFPNQDNADIVFNTSLIYELGILRLYAEPLLFSVPEDDPNYGEAIRLINLLRNILPMTSDNIPLDSIIREFIGDSYFKEE